MFLSLFRCGLHPSLPILCWLLCALILPWVSDIASCVVFITIISVFLFRNKFSELLHIIYRIRWLSLTLWVSIAWSLPGDTIGYWYWGPTFQGMMSANRYILNLWLLILLLQFIFLSLYPDELLGGMLFLARPLQFLGFPVERFMLRLQLTLTEFDKNFRVPMLTWKSYIAKRFILDDVSERNIAYVLCYKKWQSSDTLMLIAFSFILFLFWIL